MSIYIPEIGIVYEQKGWADYLLLDAVEFYLPRLNELQ